MKRMWMQGVWVAVFLAGCRTPQPNLKPAQTPEVLNPPPSGQARYDTPLMPKEAFEKDSPLKKRGDFDSNPIIPTRGSVTGGGPGGIR